MIKAPDRALTYPHVAGLVLTPLDGASIYTVWRVQYLRRLAGPVFTPLGGASIYAAWRAQC